MSLPSRESRPAYGWPHVAFALGTSALAVSFASGFQHAVKETGRPPGFSLDLDQQGEALLARGDLKRALRHYEMAARISPGDAASARRLLQLAARSGDLEAELRGLRRLVLIERHNPEAHVQLAAALLRAGRPAEARAAYSKALELRANREQR